MLDQAKAFWNSLAGKVREVVREETNNALRLQRYTVTTAPNGTVIGVTLPYGTNELFLPYSQEVASATVGSVVLVAWWGSMSNAKAYYFADGYNGSSGGGGGGGVPAGGTAGQFLKKVDGTDYNTAWGDVTAVNGIPIYKSVTELGLTSGSATISGAFTAMGYPAILLCSSAEFASNQRPNSYGLIRIIRLAATRQSIHFFGWELGDLDFRMFCEATGGGSTVPSGKWRPIMPVRIGTITTTTSWTQQTDDWTQTVTIGGPVESVGSRTKVDLQPSTAVLTQMLTDGCTAMYVENNSGTFILHALGAAPTTALTIQCAVEEVYA